MAQIEENEEFFNNNYQEIDKLGNTEYNSIILRDIAVFNNKRHYSHTCDCCDEYFENLSLIVCNIDKRRNPKFYVCSFCKDVLKYETYYDKECPLCNKKHKIVNNVECNICFGDFDKRDVIKMSCLTKKKKKVVRNYCNKCASNYNFRDEKCPYCRCHHEHDRDKYDKFYYYFNFD